MRPSGFTRPSSFNWSPNQLYLNNHPRLLMASARGHCVTWEAARAWKTRLNTGDCISSVIHKNLRHHIELSLLCASLPRISSSYQRLLKLHFCASKSAEKRFIPSQLLHSCPLLFFFVWVRGMVGWCFFFFFTWMKSAPFSRPLPHFLICGVLVPFVKPSCSLSGAKEVHSIQGYRSKGHRGPEQKRAAAKLEGVGISELCASVAWCTFPSKGVHRPEEWTENLKKKKKKAHL